eukprot:CAMPEP_0198198882 /NCGR_PEP_ID=MMETSP1445-20131203/2248_1 /TAXON_ID=36898 /ORGANISM="Pyramimonas sp., Strain CCMP2087" /LENGTH=137 /DNA_ID=CAMNT_0043868551 /DNA_START=100 /DNA_END=513 /DNA_ORIENTATION=-
MTDKIPPLLCQSGSKCMPISERTCDTFQAKEKQALVELNHKQAETLERRREEQQLLRAELAVIKGDAEAMACARPTYIGLNGQGVYLSYNSGENISKIASGKAMVPATENSVPSNSAASGESWAERQYKWNKMKLGR